MQDGSLGCAFVVDIGGKEHRAVADAAEIIQAIVQAGLQRTGRFLGVVGVGEFLVVGVLHPAHRSVRVVAVLGEENFAADCLLLARYLPAAGVDPFGIAWILLSHSE